MASLHVPAAFQKSFLESLSYPECLVPDAIPTYRSNLRSYKSRLDRIEYDLCLVEGQDAVGRDFEVPFRDLGSDEGDHVKKRNTHSPQDVLRWLGADIDSSRLHPEKCLYFGKKDPKSRFIYIYAENSRDQLKITRGALVQILTYHQVMPTYLDFILVFGAQSEPKDLRFSGFREQNQMRASARGLSIPGLGRSGQHFQLCYNLKGVSLKTQGDPIRLNEWSIRQAAIYHQFDIVFGTTLWIVTKGRLDIQQRYKELTGPDGKAEDKAYATPEKCFRSSLAVHLMLCHWSTEDWRWYIAWLESVVDAESAMAVYGPRGPGYTHRQYKPYDIQDLQYWQDKTNEAVMVIESNLDVIVALRKFYDTLLLQRDFPNSLKVNCKEDVELFTIQLDELVRDFKMHGSRIKLLAEIIKDRKQLVLQHLQGQAAERTEQLNQNLEREAILMRIITMVTLLYLPATFVSTFFSTDVIKFQNQAAGTNDPGEGSFSPTAMKRWLQVTLPLTFLTLVVAWTTYKVAESSRARTKHSRYSDLEPSRTAHQLMSPLKNGDIGDEGSQGSTWHTISRKFTTAQWKSQSSGRHEHPLTPLPFHNLRNGSN